MARLDLLASTNSLIQAWVPKNIDVNVATTGLKFNGCKQKEYQLRLNHTISKNFFVESGVAYAKGKLSWGAFDQKVSVRELSLVPRYQLAHDLSIGFGLVAQSAVEFKTTQGLQLDLPKNKEWLINARTKGFAQNHSWEVAISSQKWEASRSAGTWFEQGLANSKVSIMYNGYF